MRRHLLIPAAAAMAIAVAGTSSAQQTGHQMPGQTPPAQAASTEAIAACVQAQQQASRIADRAQARLEAARQTNSPADMRAAIDDLQAALGQIRSGLEQCGQLTTSASTGGGQEGHQMGIAVGPPAAAPEKPVLQPRSTQPAPAAADPHAGHTMPKAQPQPTKKPESPKTAPAAPARDPHAGHGAAAPSAKEAEQSKVMDPVTGLMVDPSTAPKATYQGQPYSFSSEQSRKEFLENPAKFVKKPKG